jgi:hypothetical protein
MTWPVSKNLKKNIRKVSSKGDSIKLLSKNRHKTHTVHTSHSLHLQAVLLEGVYFLSCVFNYVEDISGVCSSSNACD